MENMAAALSGHSNDPQASTKEHHHTPRSKPVLTNSVQAVSNGQVDPASDLLVLTVQNVFS